jgi:deoxyribonuclease-4
MTRREGIRFGPAGIPIGCSVGSTAEGIRCCKELGLRAMEIEFVRGVRMGAKAAEEAGAAARELDVRISSHAPYYINFCSGEKPKIANSRRHLLESAKATHLAGGRITVFHPGFYQKLSPAEAYSVAKKELSSVAEELAQQGIRTVLGAETVGRKSAFGSLLENIRLAQDVEHVEPVLDFAHLLARGDFPCSSADDYRRLLAMVEKELPGWQKHMHCHFSEINYGDKGELNHLPLGTRDAPPFKPLMKVLAENGYSGTVICESPKLEMDALLMQKQYERGG